MNIVTNIPFTDIILAALAVGLMCWLLYRGFNPKEEKKSDKAKESKPSGSKSKPSLPGVNITIGGGSDKEENKPDGQ